MADEPGGKHLFDDLPERDQAPLRGHWWALAIGLHAALLLLPVAWYKTGDEQAIDRSIVLEIQTTGVTIPEPEPVEPSLTERRFINPEGLPAVPPVQDPPDPAAKLQTVERPDVPSPPPPDNPVAVVEPQDSREKPDDDQPILDVYRLLESVASMDWESAEPSEMALGRATHSDLTDALRQPVLVLEGNTFDGITAPAEAEITDRWFLPGGEHNVVIRGPDGNSYCGRQAAPDDLRPWLQMPMMFRRCAGGGQRSGLSGWRNN